MARDKRNKGGLRSGVAAARSSLVNTRQIPWGTIAAVVAIVALAAVVFGYYLVESAPQRAQEQREEEAAEQFTPTADNPNPALDIEGIVSESYEPGLHVQPPQRVDYDHSPPIGGPHDAAWAACNGVVYDEPVRSEAMVHSLEHGAVWIAYNPEEVDGNELQHLEVRADGEPFTMMSPYPGLDTPISLQSWGHQLKVEDAEDERIDQFIVALRRNQNTYPETRGSCDALGPPEFDPDNPPPFDPSPPGDDAVPMDAGQEDLLPEDAMGELPDYDEEELPTDGEGDAGDDE
ncbi:DUF3105 domain-containing protein [Haloechinothrix sp. LS1_15]|uniref:DUF3105 domain-containing protein n=1 Tax=Haloechinothrix sp. LS1_15 TaxID=2652248 RepID=UPI002946CC87|nr:DUF3105 domain-containing protein [Haloechinothrix sp. LS1_15]MDV6011769.1 DUF3105 domain-containing protein [Haloechinothrix sp. LS1_15]